MTRSRLFAVLLSLSLFWGLVPSAAADQIKTASGAANAAALANEITVVGTIRQVLSEPAPGRPQGINLVLAGPQGVFDVPVGPFLASDVKESLSAGQQVQIAGALRKLNGKSYLLAREMTVAGRQVTVRNEHGFLVRTQAPSASSSPRSRVGLKGGNQ